jgi:hypothetical protein
MKLQLEAAIMRVLNTAHNASFLRHLDIGWHSGGAKATGRRRWAYEDCNDERNEKKRRSIACLPFHIRVEKSRHSHRLRHFGLARSGLREPHASVRLLRISVTTQHDGPPFWQRNTIADTGLCTPNPMQHLMSGASAARDGNANVPVCRPNLAFLEAEGAGRENRNLNHVAEFPGLLRKSANDWWTRRVLYELADGWLRSRASWR